MSERDGKGALEGQGKPVSGAPTNAPGSTGVKPPAPAGPQKAPPKNPGFVTCTVDGKEVVARPGTNMIEAARQAGADIPYYCYHPRLSIAANCRMCLVEVSSSPKLVPACQTPLSEGLAVKTNTGVVKDSQRSVLEFILLNHPVDCAICDQAGECKLQEYSVDYGKSESRFVEPKVHKPKRVELGPRVPPVAPEIPRRRARTIHLRSHRTARHRDRARRPFTAQFCWPVKWHRAGT